MAGSLAVDFINGDNIAGGFFGTGQVLTPFTTSERANNVTYTNNTGKAITFMAVFSTTITNNSFALRFYVDDILVHQVGLASYSCTFTFIIPNGSSYRYLLSNSIMGTIHELR